MALSYGPSIITDGLVLCLDAADTLSYPGVGTTWFDLSGQGNHGTLVNGVGYDGSNGGSLVFDGVDDYVRVTTSTPTSYNTFSYGAWIYANDTSGYRTIIDRDNDKWSLFVFNGILITYNQTFNSVYTINTNQWYYVNVTHIDGQPVLFYVNGSLIYTSSNSTVQHTTSYFGIGAGYSTPTSGNEFWAGNIAQASIYNRALTPAEISQNFNALRGRFGV